MSVEKELKLHSPPTNEYTVEALEIELQTKFERLKRLSSRWVLTCSVAMVLLCTRIGRLEATDVDEIWRLLPSISVWCGWFGIWIGKGVWDVVEDVLPRSCDLRLVLAWCLFVVGFIPALIIPSYSPILTVVMAVMVIGSVLAGGIDTLVWWLAAIFAAVGVAAGVRQHIWNVGETSIYALSTNDWIALALGGIIHAVLDAVQDRIVEYYEAKQQIHEKQQQQQQQQQQHRHTGLLHVLLSMKLVPLLAACTVVYALPSSMARATLIFALVSPHFVIYDIAKITFCFAMLLKYDVQSDDDGVAGPMADRMRRLILCMSVWFSSLFNQRVAWISDANIAQQALAASVAKGAGLEQFLSLPAWSPIVPTESVDGERWRRMRTAVARVLRVAGGNMPAPKCASVLLRERLESHWSSSNCPVLDSVAVHRALASVLHELIFFEEPSDAVIDTWVESSISWRARVGLKAAGTRPIRDTAFNLCAQLIDKSAPLQKALQGIRSVEERVSIVLQPFILSPLINVSDGFVAAAAILQKDIEQKKCRFDCRTTDDAQHLAWTALRAFPPFPILERVLPHDWHGDPSLQGGMHVFIPSDRISHSLFVANRDVVHFDPSVSDVQHPHNWLAFGAGSRACPGQALGINLLTSLIKNGIGPYFNQNDVDRKDFGKIICPANGHRYSGRQNDPIPAELWYSVKVVCTGLPASFWFGMKNWVRGIFR
jgi:hypothetical protein